MFYDVYEILSIFHGVYELSRSDSALRVGPLSKIRSFFTGSVPKSQLLECY